MQKRQKNRQQYFNELSSTSEKYYIPYLNQIKKIKKGMKVLEVGCGDGGNLLPFYKKGCHVTGVDLSETRINDAKTFFDKNNAEGQFIVADICTITELNHHYDIILCHDVIEHIEDKEFFLRKIKTFLKNDGIVFMAFPAWQMPFGGHQQICRSRLLSHLPFIHLLPSKIYRNLLQILDEDEGCIKELMNIKKTKCPIELFEKLLKRVGFTCKRKERYFINPHYEVKFGLHPLRLPPFIANIPYIRNFFTTSSFYILSLK